MKAFFKSVSVLFFILNFSTSGILKANNPALSNKGPSGGWDKLEKDVRKLNDSSWFASMGDKIKKLFNQNKTKLRKLQKQLETKRIALLESNSEKETKMADMDALLNDLEGKADGLTLKMTTDLESIEKNIPNK